jgi:thioredoxin 1
MAQVVTDANFETEVLKADLPVLVDFYADWCGPCRSMAPIVDEITKEYDSKLKVCKLNIDDNPESAGKYGVMSIPTFIIFQKGEVVEQIVGGKSKEDFKQFIDKQLN